MVKMVKMPLTSHRCTPYNVELPPNALAIKEEGGKHDELIQIMILIGL
jgi:hypothetical protein